MTGEQIARVLIGDRQEIAVAAVLSPSEWLGVLVMAQAEVRGALTQVRRTFEVIAA